MEIKELKENRNMKIIENTYQYFYDFSIEETELLDKILEGIDIKVNTKENAKLITDKILELPTYLQIHVINEILNSYYSVGYNSETSTSKLFEKVLSNNSFDDQREVIYIMVDKNLSKEKFIEKQKELELKLGIKIISYEQ